MLKERTVFLDFQTSSGMLVLIWGGYTSHLLLICQAANTSGCHPEKMKDPAGEGTIAVSKVSRKE